MNRLIAPLVLLLFIIGCGSRRPEAEIERGRQAVAAALDNWKANEPAAKLKTLTDPVDFTEELRATYSLRSTRSERSMARTRMSSDTRSP